VNEVRVFDIEDLGMPALVVRGADTKLLLIDSKADHEERLSILERFFPLGDDA
jgi:hypothetical protein